MHQHQRFAQRRADMVGEFQRRGTGAAFAAIDDDEVGRDLGFEHGLDHGEQFPRMADRKLDAYRLTVGQRAQPSDEMHQLERRRERRVARR